MVTYFRRKPSEMPVDNESRPGLLSLKGRFTAAKVMRHMNYETILTKSSRSVCISSIVDYIVITLKNEIATKQHKGDKGIIFYNFLN